MMTTGISIVHYDQFKLSVYFFSEITMNIFWFIMFGFSEFIFGFSASLCSLKIQNKKIENFENNFEFLEDTNFEHENSIYGSKIQAIKPVKQQNTYKYPGVGGWWEVWCIHNYIIRQKTYECTKTWSNKGRPKVARSSCRSRWKRLWT